MSKTIASLHVMLFELTNTHYLFHVHLLTAQPLRRPGRVIIFGRTCCTYFIQGNRDRLKLDLACLPVNTNIS